MARRIDHQVLDDALDLGIIDVGSERAQTFTPGLFLLNGIDPRRYKSWRWSPLQHFRAGFEPIAAAIVTADGGGLTTLRPEVFARARRARSGRSTPTRATSERLARALRT